MEVKVLMNTAAKKLLFLLQHPEKKLIPFGKNFIYLSAIIENNYLNKKMKVVRHFSPTLF